MKAAYTLEQSEPLTERRFGRECGRQALMRTSVRGRQRNASEPLNERSNMSKGCTSHEEKHI